MYVLRSEGSEGTGEALAEVGIRLFECVTRRSDGHPMNGLSTLRDDESMHNSRLLTKAAFFVDVLQSYKPHEVFSLVLAIPTEASEEIVDGVHHDLLVAARPVSYEIEIGSEGLTQTRPRVCKRRPQRALRCCMSSIPHRVLMTS